MFRNKYLQNFPVSIVLISVLISICGLLAIFSASEENFRIYFYKQIKFFIVFFIIAIFITFIDIRFIFNYSYIIYFVLLFILISTELFGSQIMGAKRWIKILSIKIQPSEIIKISILLMLGKYFHFIKTEKELTFRYMILPVSGIIIPEILILKQPDLGTAIIIALSCIVIFITIGVNKIYFFLSTIITALLIPTIWANMHEYQKHRIKTFINPENDSLGLGYHAIQSKIAIGSGGLWGKGFLLGTQSHLKFLPEHRTDFIFSLIAEEFGFLGCFVIILLFSTLVFLITNSVKKLKCTFSQIVTIGVSSIIFWHVFINISMTLGMLPVVGIPLPLISYGGSVTGSVLIGLGIIVNMQINKDVIL